VGGGVYFQQTYQQGVKYIVDNFFGGISRLLWMQVADGFGLLITCLKAC
jgi:hypothetical protein